MILSEDKRPEIEEVKSAVLRFLDSFKVLVEAAFDISKSGKEVISASKKTETDPETDVEEDSEEDDA